MFKNIISKNVTLVSIIIFMSVFSFTQFFKPDFLYNTDNSMREFGIGYKNKTILPIWLLSIVLGSVCYLIVMYYIANPKFF